MALMDVFTHFSIIRRERRGIRPEEIKIIFICLDSLTRKTFSLKIILGGGLIASFNAVQPITR